MSTEENKALIRRMFESFNERNINYLSEFTTSDYIDHTHNLRGPEEVKKFLTMLFKGLDFHVTLEDLIAEGDKVWVRLTLTGTHIGDFQGVAPTGEKFTEPAVQIIRITNGKITEVLQVSNELDLLMRLGLIEYTEKAKKLHLNR